LAASVQFQNDMRQGEGESIDGTLFETHVAWQQDDFQLRALYASWNFDNAINSIKDGADKQTGFYLEPSYKVTDKIGVFARYSEYDNSAGNSSDSAVEQVDIGMNYWLHPNVVFKIDYQNQDNNSGTGSDGINIGVGYSY
jgi:predicted porin